MRELAWFAASAAVRAKGDKKKSGAKAPTKRKIANRPKTDALSLEGADSPYVNYLVARPDNQNDPRVQALATALRSQAVKDFIAKKYDGAVIPAA